MRILITGATGFLGRCATADLLKQGAEIAILTRNKSNIKNLMNLEKTGEKTGEKATAIEGSLESLETCSKAIKDFNPDVCLHLAWEGIPDYSHEVSKKNLDQSIGLIDFLLKETNCNKFVVSGSCFEYGTASGSLAETADEENVSPIAWAKNTLKDYLALQCKEKNLSWVWFRIFYVYGPGQRSNSLIPSLFNAIRHGDTPSIKNPNNANDFIYISDVSDAISIACLQPVESGVYNLGSGHLSRVTDICELVRKHALRIEKQTLNPTVSNDKKNHSLSVGGYANIAKAKNKLHWEPKVSTETGVKDFVAYLLDQEKP